MINQEDIKSEFLTMENLYFEFISFKGTGVAATKHIDSAVGYKEEHIISGDELSVSLFCKLEVDNLFEAELCLKGVFKANSQEMAEKLLPNAIAIMFPYLRAQVSVLTSQPNLPSVSLKPININSFLKKQSMVTE